MGLTLDELRIRDFMLSRILGSIKRRNPERDTRSVSGL